MTKSEPARTPAAREPRSRRGSKGAARASGGATVASEGESDIALTRTASAPARMYTGGALLSPDSETEDDVYEDFAGSDPGFYSVPFPETFDLREWASTPRDQGDRQTCAAFAAAAIREIHECRASPSAGHVRMSPEFVYAQRKNRPMDGMYGRNVFQILKDVGIVPEDDFGYGVGSAPSEGLRETASKYRIANYAKVVSVDGLKRSLLELGPCYMQLPLVDPTRGKFWRGDSGGKLHAVTVVGFTTKGFILRNSWGADWNGDGHTLLPYADWDYVKECWTSIDIRAEKHMDEMKSRANLRLTTDDRRNKVIVATSVPAKKKRTCCIF